MSRPRCGICDAELVRGAVVAEAERGGVRALVEGAPMHVCPRGHDHREPVPALVGPIVADVRQGLLVSGRPRLPWRGQRCGACGEPLTMPGRRTTRSVTVTATGGPPFTVTLDLPMRRCTECAGDNLPRGAWPAVAASTRAALGG